MEKRKMKSRFQQKIRTTQEWELAAEKFVPLKGEIIVYQDYVDPETKTTPLPPRYKVGIYDPDVHKTEEQKLECTIEKLPFATYGNLGADEDGFLVKWNDSTKEFEKSCARMNGHTLWIGDATHTDGFIDIDNILWIDNEDQVNIKQSLIVGDTLQLGSVVLTQNDLQRILNFINTIQIGGEISNG